MTLPCLHRPATDPDKAMNFYQHSPEQINQLATALEDPDLDMNGLGWKAAFHLRELQALILDLEAQLCAIGAGGVEPLRKTDTARGAGGLGSTGTGVQT